MWAIKKSRWDSNLGQGSSIITELYLAGGPCAEGHGVPGKKWDPSLISSVEKGSSSSFGSSMLQMTENEVVVAIAQTEAILRGSV